MNFLPLACWRMVSKVFIAQINGIGIEYGYRMFFLISHTTINKLSSMKIDSAPRMVFILTYKNLAVLKSGLCYTFPDNTNLIHKNNRSIDQLPQLFTFIHKNYTKN